MRTTDQIQLFAQCEGNPNHPALVLVHGYPDNHRVWDALVATLLSHYYIVRYDVRGAGQSDAPSAIRSYQLAQLSRDLLSVVNTCIPNRPFHLVGHDWGSIQSWESATDSTFGRQILSFTSIAGVCLDHASFWLRQQASSSPLAIGKQLMHSWYIGVFHLPYVAPNLIKQYANGFSKLLSAREHRGQHHANPTLSRDGQQGIALYRANFIPRLLNPRPRTSAVPIHVIVCNKDVYVTKEMINALLPYMGSPVVSYTDSTHWGLSHAFAGQISHKMMQYYQQHHTSSHTLA